jgi:Ca-activated chloride channel homolog
MRLCIVILLAFCAFQVNAQADRKFIRKGNSEFENGKYQQAEIEYRKALEKDAQSFRADFNLGNALYMQKQYDAAATKYASLAEKGNDRQNLNRYYYNLGNALYENRKYSESVDAYKQALRNRPEDLDAKHNLQLAMKMLNEQKQQQDKQDQKNKDQQNKEDQNKDQKDKGQNKDQNNEMQQQKDSQQATKQQDMRGQISPDDAERILQALENEEKNVMKKVQEQKEHLRSAPLEKNW